MIKVLALLFGKDIERDAALAILRTYRDIFALNSSSMKGNICSFQAVLGTDIERDALLTVPRRCCH